MRNDNMNQNHPSRMAFLHMIADPIRHSILNKLLENDYCTATQFTNLPNLKGRETLISYHLKCLRDCGLVLSKKSIQDGRQIEFFLHDKSILETIFEQIDTFSTDHEQCLSHSACQIR